MSGITTYELHISFIWVSTILDFLKGSVPADAPMAFLGDETQYKTTFDEGRTGGGMGELKPPWFKPKEDFFWFFYTENTQPVDVKSAQAWKYLVPLRLKVPFKVSAPWLSGRAYLEGFFYPHGMALVFTVESYGHLSLEEARELAFKVRQTEFFEVDFGVGSAPQKLHLNPLADKAMMFLVGAALGLDSKAGVPPMSPPFSIWTVVKGKGVNPEEPTLEGGEVHRVLEAVTAWNPNFATAILPKLADNSARLRRKRSAGDVLYANDRGRAAWFPGTFTLSSGQKRSLACYHRNLVYTSMQVESLCRLVRETSQEIKQPGDGAKLPLPQFNCTRRAAGILARLYLALKDKTYRSGSPYLQIRQNNFLGDINRIRKEMLVDGDPLT